MPVTGTLSNRTSKQGPRRGSKARDPREPPAHAGTSTAHRESQAEAASPELVPAVRDRLHARLAAMGVAQDRAVSFLAGMTGRAPQSVRRWFDAREPGLPDLVSFARLCVGLGCGADAVLGLSDGAGEEPDCCAHLVQVADCVHAMAHLLTRGGQLGVPMRVPGDEMAPRLKSGDLVFVDTTVTRLTGNGIYALSCNDNLIIRRVEQRLGKGIVLKCDNRAYADHEWTTAASGRRHGVRVVGKVHGAISVHLF